MLSLQETEYNNKNRQNLQSVYNCSQTYMEAQKQPDQKVEQKLNSKQTNVSNNNIEMIDMPQEMVESMPTATV